MTGPEHYQEAERLLSIPGLGDDPRDALIVAEAQAHATLALASAMFLGGGAGLAADSKAAQAWREVVL